MTARRCLAMPGISTLAEPVSTGQMRRDAADNYESAIGMARCGRSATSVAAHARSVIP